MQRLIYKKKQCAGIFNSYYRVGWVGPGRSLYQVDVQKNVLIRGSASSANQARGYILKAGKTFDYNCWQ